MAKDRPIERATAQEIFLTKVETITGNLRSTDRHELLRGVKICESVNAKEESLAVGVRFLQVVRES